MDAFAPPQCSDDESPLSVRFSEKARQRARIELRKLDGRFLANLSVTRVSFFAIGFFGLLNGLGTYVLLSQIFGYGNIIIIVTMIQVLSACGFILGGMVMKKWPGYCVGVAWVLSFVTLVVAPLFYPILWFSIWTYILPVLQVLSLSFCAKFAFSYQRKRAYLCAVLQSAD